MARWQLQARARLLALACMACMAGSAAGGAGAQTGELVYEKQLDLNLNPLPSRGNPMGAPAAERGSSFYEQAPRLSAQVPYLDEYGERNDRIVMGKPAPPGAWRSVVNLMSVYAGSDGKDAAFVCGGTLIDQRWVLTAGHCAFQARYGGVRDLKWVAAFASDVHFQKGTPLRVKAVYVNRSYDQDWIINDLSLLELEKPIELPRQKLAAGAGQAVFLAPGRMSTVVGWGRTKGDDPKSLSPVLLQGSFPIVGKSACDELRTNGFSKPGRPLSDADFCAGYPGGDENPRHCQGDSGGPLFVSSATGEAIQVGIVSYARGGCPSFYGGYASVGHYEPWIRQHVPDAVFVMPDPPGGPKGPLQEIAGADPDGPPAPHGQCAVDILADGAATNRVRVGARLTVHVTTGVTGQLAVFSRTSRGRTVQLFPNRLRGAAQDGPAPAAVRPGDVTAIPSPADGFALTVSPPEGRYAVIAMVVPEAVNLAEITGPFESMAAIDDFNGVLARIAEGAQRATETMPDAPRAVCTRQFEVVAQ